MPDDETDAAADLAANRQWQLDKAQHRLNIDKWALDAEKARTQGGLDVGKQVAPNRMALAKQHLDSSKASAEAEVNWLKATADYNYRMMEVAKLQTEVVAGEIENDKQELELGQLARALKDYDNALRTSQRKLAKAEEKANLIERISLRMTRLLMGETIENRYVVDSWIALHWCVTNFSTRTAIEVMSVPTSAAKPTDFINLNDVDATPLPLPTFDYAWPLLQWAKKQRYVPRIGTVAYEALTHVIEALSTSADKSLADAQQKTTALEAQLKEVRSLSWQKISLARFGAKEPE